MTKARPPLTAHRALTTIAGAIGWEKAGELVNKAERTIRNWSDPDTTACITLDAALKLDLAFRAHGGDGYPLLRWYQLQVELRVGAQGLPVAAVADSAALASDEHGDAMAATFRALRPGATPAEIAIAVREAEESLAAQARHVEALRLLKNGEQPDA